MGNLSIYTKVVVADNSIYKTIKITITESIQTSVTDVNTGDITLNCTKPTRIVDNDFTEEEIQTNMIMQ